MLDGPRWVINPSHFGVEREREKITSPPLWEETVPTPGISMVGFMTDQQQAINHLRTACVPPVDTDAALIAEWQAAQAQLGAPIPNAGNPNIQPFPAAHQAHVQTLVQNWTQLGLQ